MPASANVKVLPLGNTKLPSVVSALVTPFENVNSIDVIAGLSSLWRESLTRGDTVPQLDPLPEVVGLEGKLDAALLYANCTPPPPTPASFTGSMLNDTLQVSSNVGEHQYALLPLEDEVLSFTENVIVPPAFNAL